MINNNDALTSLAGLENLTSIAGRFWIENNDALTSLAGLENLPKIGTYLSIINNASLVSLAGLGNLTSSDGAVVIRSNAALTSLAGLGHIWHMTIVNLSLQNSPLLSTCNVRSICDYLENGGAATISRNAFGCNSVYEIEDACSTNTDK